MTSRCWTWCCCFLLCRAIIVAALLRAGSEHRRQSVCQCHATSAPSGAHVRVCDNVVSPSTCELLHCLAVEHSERSYDGSSVFRRGVASDGKLTPLETMIDSVLSSLNDTSPLVEYWSRSKWTNLEAHADIDEDTLKDEGVLRVPDRAHVLYMKVSKELRGPTVVFPDRKVAWGSVSPRTLSDGGNTKEYIVDVENYWDDDDERTEASALNTEDMIIVPAVTGRLLRFDGSNFHSVPKPPERMVMSEKALAAYLEEVMEEEEYWDGFDDDDESHDDVRSVLLFNTWPNEDEGPRGVRPDRTVQEIPDGIVVEDDDGSESMPVTEDTFQHWKQMKCNPREEWTEVALRHSDDGTENANVRVPLMGTRARRGYMSSSAEMQGPVRGEDFYEETKVTHVKLSRAD